jgi:hypothetical protein
MWLGGSAVTGDIAESFTVPFGERVRQALAERRDTEADNPWTYCDAAMWRLDTVNHTKADSGRKLRGAELNPVGGDHYYSDI